MPTLGIGQSCAMPRQQAACPAGCIASRQADTGIPVQMTTTASIKNAPFLPQFIVDCSLTSIVSIRRVHPADSDLYHILKNKHNRPLQSQQF
jgi:hypothetical protein